MTSLQVNALNFNKKISINFNGAKLSSDSGLLVYLSFDEKLGFSKLLRNAFNNDKVSESHLTYSRSDVIL